MALPRINGQPAHYIPGTERRLVRLPDGSVVSRQTAENIFAQQMGARNIRELDRNRREAESKGTYQSKWYRQDLEAARREGRLTETEFRNLAAQVSASRDTGPDSPLAQYLYSIGRRTGYETYNVGETPNVA